MPDLNNPIGLNANGPEVRKVHGALRILGFLKIPIKELSEISFGIGTRDTLLEFQRSQGISESGVLDDSTQAKLQKATEHIKGKYCIVGKISGLPNEKVELQLYRHAFDTKSILLGKTLIQKEGYYALDYDPAGLRKANLKSALPLNIELITEFVEGRKKKRLSLSGIKYNVDRYEVLNLTAPVGDRPIKTKHDILIETLLPYIKNVNKLKDLKQKDFTFLSKSTGVNTAQIIFASAAEKMSKKTGIEPKALYALFQSSFSPNERSLALADPEEVKKTLEAAVKSGIVQLDGTIEKTVKKIIEFSRTKRPTLNAVGNLSSYKDLLSVSGLAKAEKEAFQEIFFDHRGSNDEMWRKAKKKFIALTRRNGGKKKSNQKILEEVGKKIEALQFQGKLIHLTSGNAPLVKWLQRQIKTTRGLANLATQGYDKPEKWEDLIQNELVKEYKGKKISDFIPPIYTGKSVGERLNAYANDMARTIRTSFPLQAIRRKIQDKELELVTVRDKEEHNEIVKHVLDFLNEAEKRGFELGETPLGRFFKENEKILLKAPIDAMLKGRLIRDAKENLNRTSAKSFIIKNWKRAFRGISVTSMQQNNSKNVLMSTLRNDNFQDVSMTVFLTKTIRQEKFRKDFGTDVADKLNQNLTDILQEEKRLLPQRVELSFRRKVKESIKTLVRLYQVLPDNHIPLKDDALQVLYNVGVKAGQGITAFTSDAFSKAFVREAKKLKSFRHKNVTEKGIQKIATQIYQKAWLVHATAINLVLAASQMKGSSIRKVSGFQEDDMDVMSSTSNSRFSIKKNKDLKSLVGASLSTKNRYQAAMNNLIGQYPTMEELFGSLDFCECKECQSVLGPAAYLVDLFRFLEHDESWTEFLSQWKDKHDEASYPFKSPERYDKWISENPGQTAFLEKTPYEILLKHRPDLPHLPLTCENTNTVLPYIDLVNEILEYYIINPDTADEAEESLFENFIIYDTGKITSADLLAEPQNILPDAYEKLRTARYPLILPFDLWLETVRLFFNHFDKRLWEVMEAFRSVDNLELFRPESADSEGSSFYRAQIFLEYLGISPSEYELFTNYSTTDPLFKWFKLYGYTLVDETDTVEVTAVENKAKNDLKSAKTLSRKLGVTYKELVDIVKTRFVNPGLKDLGLVWKMRIEIADAVEYFVNRDTPEYPAASKEEIVNGLSEVQAKYQQYFSVRETTATDKWENLWPEKFSKALVLRDKEGDTSRVVRCDFEMTFLEYAYVPGDTNLAATVPDLVRINLFVRLRRKLGWTIEETDWALTALWPKEMTIVTGPVAASEINDRLDKLADGFKIVLIYLAHLKYLEEKLKPGRRGRQKFITLWADIPTAGLESLYAQLFLRPTLVKNNPDADAVFDDPFEKYLNTVDIDIERYPEFRLVNQLTVLQGALGLTDNEIKLIICDANSCPLDDAEDILTNEKITLENVSLLYRYGLLAKSLNLSVKDLITLKTLSGLNPFTYLEPGVIMTLDQDYPYSQTIRFVEIASKIKESGFKIEDLDFLLRHRFDPIGKYRIVMDALPTFLGKIATGIREIEKQSLLWAELPPSDDLFREKITLLLPADSADKFSKIISGTMEYEATIATTQRIESSDFAQVPEVRVTYDSVQQVQHLFYRGFLTSSRKSQILLLVTSEKRDLISNLLEQIQTNTCLAFTQTLLNLMATMEFSVVRKYEEDYILPARNFSNFPIRLSYDKENKLQHFSYIGFLTNEIRQNIAASLGVDLDSAQLALLQDLLEKVQTAGREIFDPLFISCIGKIFSTIEFEVAVLNAVLDPLTIVERLTKEEPAISDIYVERITETVSYQYLTYKGLLNDSEKNRIADSDINLTKILDEVQSKQREIINYFRVDFLQGEEFDELFGIIRDGTSVEINLGNFPAPEEISRKQLAMSLRPFLLRRQRSDFITEMIATDMGFDPLIIKDILSEPTLLSDPSVIQEVEQEPDSVYTDLSLMEAFADLGKEGADTTFFITRTLDGSDVPVNDSYQILMTSINTSARKEDGTEALFRPDNVGEVRFEGWFKVPTDGDYRFFAIRSMNETESESMNKVEAEFRLKDFPDQVIRMNADDEVDEVSSVVKLKGGIPYEFSFEAKNLMNESETTNDVRLEIVGGTLSRQDLGKLDLYPSKAVERATRARILAIKTIQILKTLGLNSRETTYLLNHRMLFDNLEFEFLALHDAQLELEKIARKKQSDAEEAGSLSLPWTDALSSARSENAELTREADLPIKFFKALMRLVEYASLKKELSPESDDLISVMENAGRSYFKDENPELTVADKVKDAHFNQVATLMGRVSKIIREAAEELKFSISDPELIGDGNGWWMETPDLRTEKGIRRLWETLQIIEIFGISAKDLKDATGIVADDSNGLKIALNLRNAIKARYEIENWRKIVKNISDELRRKKRDALVAYIIGKQPEIFTMQEKLFEWFLVDPGMEPVVKTSRIRMALESVRRFIQRCLDGKELWVSPAAIDKEQWKVRGRFRFWQANRRIFLYPENWLEPEFRDDKSHLYQELEGTLLQGDVSDELVEDAFFKYLKGLEEISRLEIVTVYQEMEDDPHKGWLHVIGRTHNLPHKYFYHRYDGSEWTPWEPIDVEIEGDNVVAIVWKQKLHLFWATFMEKAVVEQESTETGESIEDMAKTKDPQITTKKIEAQLNWTDYFQGQWRTRQASEFMNAIPGIYVASHTPDSIFVYALKERVDDIEGPVQIRYHIKYEMFRKEIMIAPNPIPAEEVYAGYTDCDEDVHIQSILHGTYEDFNVIDYDYTIMDTIMGTIDVIVEGFGKCYGFLLGPYGGGRTIKVIIPEHPRNPSQNKYISSEYNGAFRLLNKNCPPEIVDGGSLPLIPYSCGRELIPFVRSGSRYWGKGAFNGHGMTILRLDYRGSPYPHVILDHESPFPISLSIPDYPYESVRAGSGIRIVEPDVRPFFYQDDVNIFFVQPNYWLRLKDVNGWNSNPRIEKKHAVGIVIDKAVAKVD